MAKYSNQQFTNKKIILIILKIKCFPEFDIPYSQILISGEKEDYLRAAKYLASKNEAFFNDSNFAIYYDSGIIPIKALHINKKECTELSEIFLFFGLNSGGYHDYYDIEALDDTEIEIRISIDEYDDEMFNR